MGTQDKITYIATISGGKDSTTMCDLLLKNGYPVDLIVFNDTLIEHDEMYEYINKLEDYFKLRYKKSITRLKPNKKPNDIIFRKVKKEDSKYYGMIKGIFAPTTGFCEWRTEAKIRPLERYLREKGIKNYKIYFGYTTNEKQRINRDDDTKLFPLVDDFKMSERNCKEYLISQGMENPLYRHFNRTGCRYCPAQSKKDKFTIWKYFPEVWQEMKDIETELRMLENNGEKVIYNNWHLGETIAQMEQEFEKENKQGTFNFPDEPLKDCFCKI